MWRNFRFPHNCHTWKAEIFHHDNFFSTNIICDICDKYQLCVVNEVIKVNGVLWVYWKNGMNLVNGVYLFNEVIGVNGVILM